MTLKRGCSFSIPSPNLAKEVEIWYVRSLVGLDVPFKSYEFSTPRKWGFSNFSPFWIYLLAELPKKFIRDWDGPNFAFFGNFRAVE